MDDRVLAIIAILLGVLIGVVLLVPFVALSYRRRGGLTVGRAALWFAGLVYFCAIWTYTLLPLPDPDTIRCAGVNLDLLAFVDDIRGAVRPSGVAFSDPALLQLLLNVVLFIPLGFFVRVLGGRGIVAAGLIGIGVSAFIETTQLTGVWGLYPCAYRVFDVDDLLTNTVGALIGSVVGLVVPKSRRGVTRLPDAELPRPVTRRRRLLGMLCDLVGATMTSWATAVIVQSALYVLGAHEEVAEGTAAAVVGDVTAIVIWFLVVMTTGRSVGDLAVLLRFEGTTYPVWLARVLRFAAGIGGYLILVALPGAWGLVGGIFAALSLALMLTTDDRRGLPGIVSGQKLVDARVRELLQYG
ncbi:VanZ family protein [Microbacterium sp.]|uniref:VanZ family protein n=1 Tax=Microbacterium sp. TaxID=51671 RepID=UPI002D792931|nr:VanZ family protein [Microbacterium sp.]HET6301406.1 VanZ family protein [Microbacterium sp.]